jgi:ABC-type amino acid transport substrate-binding protein
MKLNNTIQVFFVVAILFSNILISCDTGNGAETKNPLDGLTLVDGTLKIGIEMNYEPYEYYGSDGAPIGFDVELAYAIGELNEIEIEFVELLDTDWNTSFTDIDNRYCDCIISAVTITEDREENYLFSRPYFDEGDGTVSGKLGILFNKNDVEICNVISSTLVKLFSNGKLINLSQKYFGKDGVSGLFE